MLLEIIALFFLCRALGNMLRKKGRTPIGYQVLLVVAVFGSEALVGIAVVAVSLFLGGEPEVGLGAIAIGIGAAAISAGLVFLIVHLLPSLNTHPGPQPFRQQTPDGQNPFRQTSKSDNPFEPPRQ